MSDYVIDIETDGIQATKIHCLVSCCDGEYTTLTSYIMMKEFLLALTEQDNIVGHNFVMYDKPTLERILGITIKAKIIDTLSLSWYLYPLRQRHGLEYWGVEFGIPKPVIDDWESLDLAQYIDRCIEDVKINKQLWDTQLGLLNKIYEGKLEPLIRYLSFKMYMISLQEKSRWSLDVEAATKLLEELEDNHAESSVKLSEVMPMVDKIAKRNYPKLPYKQDGTLSASGAKWLELCKDNGIAPDSKETIEVVVGQEDANPGSSSQVKSWLTGLGWVPRTYKFVEDRKIPQIKTASGELCRSVSDLSSQHPQVMVLTNMAVVKHRIGLIKGLLKSEEGGFIMAQVAGLTNTLRYKHKTAVNIPSLRKPYGKEIRALLRSRSDRYELCGSDMSSLEDRIKQHYVFPIDPQFVEDQMKEGFDPHLDLALAANAITDKELEDYKNGVQPDSIVNLRHQYKGSNYALQYGSGIKGLSKQLGISVGDASKISKAYWDRNWAVKAVADDLEVKDIDGTKWLLNPVSKLYYVLRSDKDRFSTLCQGTGTFVFDLWIKCILEDRVQLTANFHDEIILEVRVGSRDKCMSLLDKAIQKVNSMLQLNRDLEVDIQFGKNYSEIH